MLASIDLEQGLEEAWPDVVTFAPKLLGFFLILLIGWFVAKALSKAADALLERVGFDGWVERGSIKAAFDRSKTDASDLIGVIVFWTVFLITLQLAFGIWGPNPISDLLAGVSAISPTSSSRSSSWSSPRCWRGRHGRADADARSGPGRGTIAKLAGWPSWSWGCSLPSINSRSPP